MFIERRNENRFIFDNKAYVIINQKKFEVEVKDLTKDTVQVITDQTIVTENNIYFSINDLKIDTRLLDNRDTSYILQFKNLDTFQSDTLSKYFIKIKQDRRALERRLSSKNNLDNKRNKERRCTYPFLIKCERMSKYKNLEQKGLMTYLREVESASDCTIIRNGREMINLASNNYLGLTTHPEVKEAAKKAIDKYGIGTGSSRVLSGTVDLHRELENRLAKFKNTDDCVLFSTGYTANVGTISLLAGANDYLIIDRKNHASIIDGCYLAKSQSNSQIIIYKHNDMSDLEHKIKKLSRDASKLIITDSVFSMDGDIANLPAIYEIAEEYRAPIMIDDAHGIGVLGNNGKGSGEHFGLEGKISIILGTLSKALGGLGGFVASNKSVIHCLRHFSRGFIFTTSLPPLISAASLKALDILERDNTLVKKLQDNIAFLKDGLLKKGFNLGNTQTAIIPVIVGSENIAHKIVKALEGKGFYVNAVGYPAVRKREARIRVSLMATHTKQDLQYFVDKAYIKECA